MKLNLGCGRHPMEGWMNLDREDLPGVDMVADLDHGAEILLPDNSVSTFYGSHILEHITDILPLMQELHRIAKPGAIATFRVPYGSSDDADEDPTHVRRFFMQSWGYFSQPYYWRAYYGYRGDWQMELLELAVDKALCEGVKPQELLGDVRRYRNIVREMIATLKAVKPIREPKRELQARYPVTFLAV